MSATLQAAARSASADPEATIVIADQPCERPRFPLVPLYNDASGDAVHAACVTSNGTICRMITAPTGGNLYIQRITDPTIAAQWTNWTDTGQIAWSDPDDGLPPRIDIAAGVNAGSIYAIYTKHGGAVDRGQVWWMGSADHGANWTNWALMIDLGNSTYIRGLALCHTAGLDYCWIAANPGGGTDQDNYLRYFYYTEGAWAPGGEYLYSRWPIDGIDARFDGVHTIELLIADGSPRQLTHIPFHLPDVTFLTETTLLLTGVSGVTAPYEPRWIPMPASVPRLGLTYIERSTSPAYTRANIAISPVANSLTEEVQWEWTSNYGLDVFYSATDGYWYFTQANRAMRALAYTGASGEIISIPNARVVAFTHDHDAESPGSFDLTVDNADGAYNALTGANACIRVGAQLSLKWGYRTSAGLEQIVQTPLWITGVGYEPAPERGESYLRIRAHDTWAELDSLYSKRQLTYSARSLAYIAQRAWWRVLGRAESDPIASMATTLPAYQIAPGTRWSTVLRALTHSVATIARFRSNQSTPTGWTSVQVDVPNWTGAAVAWTWGASGLPEVARARYWTQAQPVHAVYVQGTGYWGEHHDWTGTRADWRDIPAFLDDRTMDSQAEATARADNAWYWHESAKIDDQIEVWPVPGLEPGDCITYADPRYGITANKRVVRHITTVLERRTGQSANRRQRLRFIQQIKLEFSS